MTCATSPVRAGAVASREVLDRGFVRLLNISGPQRRPEAPYDADIVDVAKTARISFAADGKERERGQDLRLAHYLAKHRHTTPFEMIETWWEVKAPIFVARQWFRHRTASINEVSRRYVEDEPEAYEIVAWREAVTDKKQGSGQIVQAVDRVSAADAYYDAAIDACFVAYQRLLDLGVAAEQARMVLPLSTYTRFVWHQDLHNLTHLLNLRAAPDAQWEIRQYADAMQDILTDVLPDWRETIEHN